MEYNFKILTAYLYRTQKGVFRNFIINESADKHSSRTFFAAATDTEYRFYDFVIAEVLYKSLKIIMSLSANIRENISYYGILSRKNTSVNKIAS